MSPSLSFPFFVFVSLVIFPPPLLMYVSSSGSMFVWEDMLKCAAMLERGLGPADFFFPLPFLPPFLPVSPFFSKVLLSPPLSHHRSSLFVGEYISRQAEAIECLASLFLPFFSFFLLPSPLFSLLPPRGISPLLSNVFGRIMMKELLLATIRRSRALVVSSPLLSPFLLSSLFVPGPPFFFPRLMPLSS